VFQNIESPYSVVRYHSLIIEKDSLPNELKITGVLEDNPDIIMAVQHKERPIYGVQFHPESIDTDYGMKLIENFLAL
jgi:anthranilate/para-aminobenzoate synthase component II